MALHEEIKIDYNKKTFEGWQDLFGDSLTMRVDSQVQHLLNKTSGNPDRISIEFSGDIATITPNDVANRTVQVTARAMVDGRQTLRGKLCSAARSIFRIKRGRRQSRAAEQKIRYIVVCSFVVIQS